MHTIGYDNCHVMTKTLEKYSWPSLSFVIMINGHGYIFPNAFVLVGFL